MTIESQNLTKDELMKTINELFSKGMVSREYAWQRMLFGKEVSEIMPYKKAFAELTKRKKEDSSSEHRIVKVNSGQYQVVSDYKGSYIDQLDTKNLFLRTEKPVFPPVQKIGPFTTEIFPYFRPQA